jgi:hypothetical protein
MRTTLQKRVSNLEIVLRFSAVTVGLALLSAQSPTAAQSPGTVAANESIPAGQGVATESGKFVPATATENQPAMTREVAEKQLRAALKVEETAPGKFRIGRVKFEAETRTVSIPAEVHLRGGVIEYVLTTEAGKAHEAMLTTKASPRDVLMACLLLGMKVAPLTGASGEAMKIQPAEGVKISVSWETNGPRKTLPLSALLGLTKGAPGGEMSPMPERPWHFTGSRFYGSGPFAADVEGSVIALIRDDSALVNNPDPTRDNDDVHVPNTTALPAQGTPVTVIFHLPAKP